ncbi:MAG: hypothetical protein F4Z73_06300 [Synechococcus sp. SB0668_bin_13]|nr:hypothetical protein [Synechococcus sp. SB0668_bin_13]
MSSEEFKPSWEFIEADPYGLFIYGNDKSSIRKELSQRLGFAYDEERNSITLVGTSAKPRQLPVEMLSAEDAPDLSLPRERPLWSSRKISVEDAPKPQNGDPKIAAFFSFKGGVGRTTSCFATAIRLLSATPAAKVLYVDADLEAPGLTWMTEDAPEGDAWSQTMSWVDALCLVQDADDWEAEALPLIVEQVRQSTISLELKVGRRQFFFMPAVRSMDQVEKLPITPENAVRRLDREWVIGNLLVALGRRLGVDVILVDLRAGITEFSSPLLLDPRVHTVIVSSCAKQSVSGVCRTLPKISRHTTWPLDAGNLTFLVTQVPPKPMAGEQVFVKVETELMDAWTRLRDKSDNDQEEDDDSVNILRIDYDPGLIVFDDLKTVANYLPGISLWLSLQNLVNQLAPSKSLNRIPKEQTEKIRNSILKLTEERLEFAEQNEQSGILAIPPIHKLVSLPDEKLPIAVVLGSKGAGKTFLWSQLVMAKSFARFAEIIHTSWQSSKPVLVFPLLFPDNLAGTLLNLFLDIEEKALEEQRERLSDLDLKKKLKEPDSENSSLTFWLEAIAGRLGLPKETGASLRKIEEELAQRDQYFVLVVDGLEEALKTGPDKPMNERQKDIIRSLIIDLPNQLQAIQAKHLGIVVFIRYDLARESIYQNFGQFEAKYRSFALKWSKEDALRLVLWVLKQAGWPDDSSTNELTRSSYDNLSSYDDLKERLQPFWSEKMGGKKEAFTDSWIIAALSDLRGRFQARDIIRFLSKATEGSETFPLSPAAMRAAIEPCAQEKVKELEKEISGLETIFDFFRGFPEDQKIMPIEESKLSDLSSERKTFLADQGILIKDKRDNKFYMPEIIWKGLGFRSSRPGRIGTMRLQRLAAAKER